MHPGQQYLCPIIIESRMIKHVMTIWIKRTPQYNRKSNCHTKTTNKNNFTLNTNSQKTTKNLCGNHLFT